MNKIILSGNLCNDIETNTYNDRTCVKNSIAVKRDFKNKNGEYDTDFFNITLWGSHAEYISKYAKKGYKVLVSGKLLNNEYEASDGTKKFSNDIQVEQIEIISSRRSTTPENDEETTEELPTNQTGEEVTQEPENKEENDDDLFD